MNCFDNYYSYNNIFFFQTFCILLYFYYMRIFDICYLFSIDKKAQKY